LLFFLLDALSVLSVVMLGIFKKGFCPELALKILAQTTEIASEIQKSDPISMKDRGLER